MSDIVINICKSPWGMQISPAHGKFAMRKLTNEQIVFCWIIKALYMSPGKTRRAQHAWLVEFVRTWAGGPSQLQRALGNISPSTLERYIYRAQTATVRLRNNQSKMLCTYFEANEATAKDQFPMLSLDNDVLGHNLDWIAKAVGLYPQQETKVVTESEQQPDPTFMPADAKQEPEVDLLLEKSDRIPKIDQMQYNKIVVPTRPSEAIVVNGLGASVDEEAIPYEQLATKPKPKPKGFFGRLMSIFG